MKLRYATTEDIRRVFGDVPASMRAIVIDDDGSIAGVAGVAVLGDHLQAFSKITDKVRGRKILLGRAVAMFSRILSNYTGPVFAVCSEDEPTAPGLLSHLGFRHWSAGVWRHG